MTRTRRAPSGAAVLRVELTDAIVEVVIDELAEKGYARTSMDGVARRAEVGKSSLYRRWSSKQDMVADAVSQLSVPLVDIPDSGSLRGDTERAFEMVAQWLSDERLGRILPDLTAEAKRNPALAKALTEHLENPRRAKAEPVLDRAIARGELPPDVDRELALDIFAAPIYWRYTVRRTEITPEFLATLTDSTLAFLGARPAKKRRR
ncbi:TetR/AcrR family transcriptional regulator [Amycolatopsis methanolica]|uniref:TetR/AcrR family transcriptional regulator n=1 Tax=Amycolatopsis methanolica TaxID=1814 RepID=UPI00342B3A6B